MRLPNQLLSSLLVLCAASLGVAATWGFEDATVSVNKRGAGVGGGFKEKIGQNKALSKPVTLGASETLKILLTTKEDNKAKRPHQAFLLVQDPQSKLDTSFAFQVKENGKGKIELTQKDLPTQLLSSTGPLDASLIIASFGSSKPYNGKAFDLTIELDSGSPLPASEKPLRYGKLPEIHHIFKSDPKSPPKIITLVFAAAVIAALPILLGAWISLGANLNHFSKAFSSSPIPHALFFSSILAMEGVFFMYYTSWNLFQTLPPAFGIGLVTFLSGSRALREVQGRRIAGLR
ncbi:hypothetical protein HO133_008498 [Letharia lupina]|uniref:Ribophorin II C-terminal domain-containing protein n=1 Tax=Letharia lupina TaxID=560253 RepID=A0A8H6CP21_9LECA|nr:uncharacterized protein HO133_008498 [Letharia lupina]KAF6227057.1 hypothetical protein HO133_008498 [Letharia lupina]